MSLTRSLGLPALRSVIRAVASCDIRLFLLLKGLTNRCSHELDRLARENLDDVERSLPQARVVLAGPFAGMRYAIAKSYCSTYLPKMLGTYECELSPWLVQIASRRYDYFVNIGAAEGFYTIGLSRLFPFIVSYAFEADPTARELLRANLCANGLENRVRIHGVCSPDSLAQIKPTHRGLLMCDCEGAEDELLDGPFLPIAGRYDMLVELHDFAAPNIAARLRMRFAETHRWTLIPARPRRAWEFPLQLSLSRFQRQLALQEFRARDAAWAWLESNTNFTT